MVPGERVPAEIDPWYVQILEARPQNSQKIREPEQLSNIDGILAKQPSTSHEPPPLWSNNDFKFILEKRIFNAFLSLTCTVWPCKNSQNIQLDGLLKIS